MSSIIPIVLYAIGVILALNLLFTVVLLVDYCWPNLLDRILGGHGEQAQVFSLEQYASARLYPTRGRQVVGTVKNPPR